MKESHEELKERARRWLEEREYSVWEEIDIGSRRVDILGIKPSSPGDIVGIECGEINNKTPPPEGITIFHLPYGSSEPYRWEPPVSLGTPTPLRLPAPLESLVSSPPSADTSQVCFHKRTYKVRKGTSGKSGRSLEISLPAILEDSGVLKAGDEVEVLFNGLIVIVPPGESLSPKKLAQVIELAKE